MKLIDLILIFLIGLTMYFVISSVRRRKAEGGCSGCSGKAACKGCSLHRD